MIILNLTDGERAEVLDALNGEISKYLDAANKGLEAGNVARWKINLAKAESLSSTRDKVLAAI